MSEKGSTEITRAQVDAADISQNLNKISVSRRSDVTRVTAEEKKIKNKYEEHRNIEKILKNDREKLESRGSILFNTILRIRYRLKAYNKSIDGINRNVQDMRDRINLKSSDSDEMKKWNDMVEKWDNRLQKWEGRVPDWSNTVRLSIRDIWGGTDDNGYDVIGQIAEFQKVKVTFKGETLPQMQAILDREKKKQKELNRNFNKLDKDMIKIDAGLINIENKFNGMLDDFSKEQAKSEHLRTFSDLATFKLQGRADPSSSSASQRP